MLPAGFYADAPPSVTGGFTRFQVLPPGSASAHHRLACRLIWQTSDNRRSSLPRSSRSGTGPRLVPVTRATGIAPPRSLNNRLLPQLSPWPACCLIGLSWSAASRLRSRSGPCRWTLRLSPPFVPPLSRLHVCVSAGLRRGAVCLACARPLAPSGLAIGLVALTPLRPCMPCGLPSVGPCTIRRPRCHIRLIRLPRRRLAPVAGIHERPHRGKIRPSFHATPKTPATCLPVIFPDRTCAPVASCAPVPPDVAAQRCAGSRFPLPCGPPLLPVAGYFHHTPLLGPSGCCHQRRHRFTPIAASGKLYAPLHVSLSPGSSPQRLTVTLCTF